MNPKKEAEFHENTKDTTTFDEFMEPRTMDANDLNQIQADMEIAQGGSSSMNPFSKPSFLLDLDIAMEQTPPAAFTTAEPQTQQQLQQQHSML